MDNDLEQRAFDSEGEPTATSDEQKETEYKIRKNYINLQRNPQSGQYGIYLARKKHVAFLLRGIRLLGSGWQGLDASRPWLCYWILHALDILGELDHHPDIIEDVPLFLEKCQDPSGGFGGGPGQLPHLAPTYAAVNALVICGTEKALSIIDRPKVYQFLLSRKDRINGGFVMHENGENDVRGTYCALSVAKLLNIITPELIEGVPEFIGRCQTYEGGMGGFPGNEAHGGYTFCALAALILTGQTDVIDKQALVSWAVNRQMPYEGGFQGRTNKLVDSCYSFWQGGIFPLIHMLYNNLQVPLCEYPAHQNQDPHSLNAQDLDNEDEEDSDYTDSDEEEEERNVNQNQQETVENASESPNKEGETTGSWLFIQKELQRYILLHCQDRDLGGLKDKPGKSKDYYHSCYALSGLSVAQHNADGTVNVVGPSDINLVEPVHPIHNIHPEKVQRAYNYFNRQ